MNTNIYLCIKDCDIQATNEHYYAGQFVESEVSPCRSCFISVSKEQHKELCKILTSIEKEKQYQERQHLAIRNAHPRTNWKAEQRLTGSLQEARSMRARFNKAVSQIAGKEIEVFWDCRTNSKTSW